MLKPPHSRTFFRWEPAHCQLPRPPLISHTAPPACLRGGSNIGWRVLEGGGGCWRVVQTWELAGCQCISPPPWLACHDGCWPVLSWPGRWSVATVVSPLCMLSDIKMLKLDFNCSEQQEFPRILLSASSQWWRWYLRCEVDNITSCLLEEAKNTVSNFVIITKYCQFFLHYLYINQHFLCNFVNYQLFKLVKKLSEKLLSYRSLHH